MLRLATLVLAAIMLVPAAQAQTWEFHAFDRTEVKNYLLTTKHPGTVHSCNRGSGKMDLKFSCSSRDWRIRAFIDINDCQVDIGQPIVLNDRRIFISTDQFRNMPGTGSILSFDGRNASITAFLSDVQRFHAMILGSEGAFSIRIMFPPNVVFRTEHYLTNSSSFQSLFNKFPSQCRM